MSLMSTILAFVLLPLIKRAPEEVPEAELTSYKRCLDEGRERVALSEQAYRALAERYRLLEQDRDRLHSVAEYWQRAYHQLAAGRPWLRNEAFCASGVQYSQEQQISQESAQQLQQMSAQQMSAQQMSEQMQQMSAQGMYQQMPGLYLDCTCVPARADVLSARRRFPRE